MKLTNYTNNRKIIAIVFALTMLVVPFYIGRINTQIESKQSLCPFKMLTGFPCPGCGITKSLIYIYKGDLLKSIEHHLFGPFVFLGSLYLIIALLIELITQKSILHKLFFNIKIAYVVGALLAIYHLVRVAHFIYSNNISQILKQSIWQ